MTDLLTRLILVALTAIIGIAGAVLRAHSTFKSEIRRRERVVIKWVNKEGRKLGLRGHYTFSFDNWSSAKSTVGSGYDWIGEEDKLLWGRVGVQLQTDGISRANKMFWTDRAFSLGGLALFVIAIVTGAAAALV
jgi:hypothetical protein